MSILACGSVIEIKPAHDRSRLEPLRMTYRIPYCHGILHLILRKEKMGSERDANYHGISDLPNLCPPPAIDHTHSD